MFSFLRALIHFCFLCVLSIVISWIAFDDCPCIICLVNHAFTVCPASSSCKPFKPFTLSFIGAVWKICFHSAESLCCLSSCSYSFQRPRVLLFPVKRRLVSLSDSSATCIQHLHFFSWNSTQLILRLWFQKKSAGAHQAERRRRLLSSKAQFTSEWILNFCCCVQLDRDFWTDLLEYTLHALVVASD